MTFHQLIQNMKRHSFIQVSVISFYFPSPSILILISSGLFSGDVNKKTYVTDSPYGWLFLWIACMKLMYML